MVKKATEGVGKKIVEALKKQSEIEIIPVPTETQKQPQEEIEIFESPISESDFREEAIEETSFEDTEVGFGNEDLSDIKTDNNMFNYQQMPQMQAPQQENFIKELDTFEIPSNIAVLKKLIAQLPNGVTRHTGAQIIKQTMEALGISMKSVLQEAQQVQEGLNTSANECFSTIQEYKKQIAVLEKQAQNYHRQYTALNELISLFIQTGI